MPDLFGVMPDGTPVHRFRLETAVLRVEILEIGAAIQSIEAPDRRGERANVVLGMKTLEDYRTRSPHFGAVPGRYAGRIGGGRFTLDGVAYQLACNAPPNALHGGPDGFGRRAWRASDHGPTHLTLDLVSPDGDAGYPGELRVQLRYSLDGPALHMDYTAETTRPTILNLTNHSYFNLAGEGSGTILGHSLRVDADRFLPVDATSIPTGEQRDVAGTPFDFRVAQRIGARIHEADPQLILGRGYDHAYMLRGTGLRTAARLVEPESGRRLTVVTTEPALQVYTANNLMGELAGPSGRTYRQTDAICLEAQHPGDSPNQPAFPRTVLRPGEIFRATTIFRLDAAESDQD